jgi:hypothetical protein
VERSRKVGNKNSLKAFLHDVERVGDGGVPGNILDGLPGEEDEAPVAHPAAVGVRHRLKGGEHPRLKHREHTSKSCTDINGSTGDVTMTSEGEIP